MYDLGIPRRLSRAELTLLCQQNRAWLLAYCQKRAGNQHDAEDLVQAVFEKLQRRPPKHPIVNPRVFLATVALNLTKDAARREARSPRSASYAMELLDQLASEDVVGRTSSLDAKRFIEMAKPLLTPRQLEVLAYNLALEGGVLTEEEVCVELDLKPTALRITFQRLAEHVGEAIVAATLAVDDAMRCPEVTKAVSKPDPHGTLCTRIHKHVKTCTACRERKAATLEGVRKAIFVVPIGVLGTLLTLKKVAVAAVVAAAAIGGALVVVQEVKVREPGVAMPATVSQVASPVVRPEMPVQPSGSASQTVAPTVPATSAAPTLAAVKPSPTPLAQTRVAPTIVAGSDAIEHRTIGTGDRCRSSTRVKVGVNAPSGVDSVRMTVRIRDTTVTISMIRMGETWYSQVGPFPERYAGHTADVTVVAVAKDGQQTTKGLGQVQVVKC